MNHLLCAFGIVWIGLGMYIIHLLRTRSLLSGLTTRGDQNIHG